MFNKIHEKVHKFPYIYKKKNIQMFSKIHEKVHKRLNYFITWYIKPKNQSKIYPIYPFAWKNTQNACKIHMHAKNTQKKVM